ncbi:hypothetical protein [Rubritalea tangerina]
MRWSVIPVVFGWCSLASCTQSLSERELESIQSVGIAEHAQSEGANVGVRGGPSVENAETLSLLLEDAIRSGALGAASEADQSVSDYVVPRLADSIEQRAMGILKSDGFFGEKLKKDASHYFDGEVVRYGLVRDKHSGGDAEYYQAHVELRVWLEDSEGKKLFSELMDLRSQSAFTVADYVEGPEKLKQVFREVGGEFDKSFKELLDRELGR